MEKINRRSFLKICGVSAIAPAALLKAFDADLKKFGKTSMPLNGYDVSLIFNDISITAKDAAYSLSKIKQIELKIFYDHLVLSKHLGLVSNISV